MPTDELISTILSTHSVTTQVFQECVGSANTRY
jgi:hypothetical protein